MLIDDIKPFKKLPFSKDYLMEKEEIDFFNRSYDANGPEYTLGTCPNGNIIPKFECEEYDDYQTRRKLCPTRSYVSSVINKYNASIFRNEPARATSSSTYDLLYKDADGYGNSLNKVMREALKKAQIDGSCYLLADSTATDTEILTIAQYNSSGARPYIRVVDASSVLNYIEVENKLLEAIVLLEDSQGKEFARYMNDEVYVDITLGRDYLVQAVSEPYSHGYSSIPLVEIEPFDDAQAKPISYSQKTIVNLLSLLNQELVDHTFTKHILSGVRLPDDDDQSKKITYGSKRMIVLEDANAKIETIGSDVSQSESLRAQIKLEEDNLYYSAGFGKNNLSESNTNMSGYALEISREDFFIYCSDLKVACEDAENRVMSLIAEKESFEYIPVVYSNRFIVDDNGVELAKLRDALALNLPSTFKKLLVTDYITKFYNLSDEQKSMIESELNNQ